MRYLSLVVCFVMAAAFSQADDKKEGATKVATPLDLKMKGIDGKEVELSKFKGKVVLFVNVASKCGYTGQYKGLQALYEKHEKDGLVIIGVPANEFGAQEPGTDEEIQKFCSTKYNVTFPMLAKVVVKGDGICPLYKFLTEKATNPKSAGDIKWNFEKFLLNRKGEIVSRFDSSAKPDGDELTKAISEELANK
jgi:glutathione peroxidase